LARPTASTGKTSRAGSRACARGVTGIGKRRAEGHKPAKRPAASQVFRKAVSASAMRASISAITWSCGINGRGSPRLASALARSHAVWLASCSGDRIPRPGEIEQCT
jgi:hypothetical protein